MRMRDAAPRACFSTSSVLRYVRRTPVLLVVIQLASWVTIVGCIVYRWLNDPLGPSPIALRVGWVCFLLCFPARRCLKWYIKRREASLQDYTRTLFPVTPGDPDDP